MKFAGVVSVDGVASPCTFEIREPSPSSRAPFECRVITSYPRSIQTTLYGVDEASARASAVAFLRQIFGRAELRDASGAPVQWPGSASGTVSPGRPAPEGAVGLVLLLTDDGADRLRLQVDMVERRGTGWAYRGLATRVDYDRESVLKLALSHDQFAEIGFNLVATLVAHFKRAGGG